MSRISVWTSRAKLMPIPVREIDRMQSITTGFRAGLVESEGNGEVTTGGGFGSPWINIEWKGRLFAIHGVELLAAVVGTYDQAEAEQILSALKEHAPVAQRT